MKTRTPISIYIAITIGITVMAFEMFAQDANYFSTPLFWALLIIITILLLIMNSIGDLVENERFARLTDEEKQDISPTTQLHIFRSFGTRLLKNNLKLKKKIF